MKYTHTNGKGFFIRVISKEEAFRGKPRYRTSKMAMANHIVYYKQENKAGKIRIGRLPRSMFEEKWYAIPMGPVSSSNRDVK